MTRRDKMFWLSKMIGKKNLSRLQSSLKYILSFRKSYDRGNKQYEDLDGKKYVFIVDGKTLHGGLSDRFRGLFSVYDYCKRRGYKFKVLWTYPEKLQKYFVPSTIDWEIAPEEMIYDRKVVDFKFFNSYSFMNNDEKSYAKLLDSNKPIIHVYSNVTMHEELFSKYFHELFTPSFLLETAISNQLAVIGSHYISITFRLIGLLGDFVDRPDIYPELEDSESKMEYIKACINAIEVLKARNPNIKKILVTADSPIFLREANKIDYVYVIPGEVVHIDQIRGSNEISQIKSYLDFMLIAKAEKCYYYTYGKMFTATKFAYTAALVGGKKIEKLEI